MTLLEPFEWHFQHNGICVDLHDTDKKISLQLLFDSIYISLSDHENALMDFKQPIRKPIQTVLHSINGSLGFRIAAYVCIPFMPFYLVLPFWNDSKSQIRHFITFFGHKRIFDAFK